MRQRTLQQRYNSYLQQKKVRLEHLAQHRLLQKPELLWQDRQQLLDERTERLQQILQRLLQQKRQQLSASARAVACVESIAGVEPWLCAV